MAISVFIDRIVYSSFNQTSLTNVPIYTVTANGLYNVSVCGFIPAFDTSTGQGNILWQVLSSGIEVHADVNVLAQTVDSTSSNSVLIYLKAGQNLTISTSITVGAPPTPFHTFMVVEPIQSF